MILKKKLKLMNNTVFGKKQRNIEILNLTNEAGRNVESLRKNHKEFMKDNKLIFKSQQRFRREKHNAELEKLTRFH